MPRRNRLYKYSYVRRILFINSKELGLPSFYISLHLLFSCLRRRQNAARGGIMFLGGPCGLCVRACVLKFMNTISYKKLIRRWDTRTSHRFILLSLLGLTSRWRGSPGTISVIFLHGGQRMAKVQNGEEILPKVSTPWVGRTNVTDDRRVCDSKDPNVT